LGPPGLSPPGGLFLWGYGTADTEEQLARASGHAGKTSNPPPVEQSTVPLEPLAASCCDRAADLADDVVASVA
jgi:hypothetical protein